ncbi:MAG: DUF805 domain-containing protein [Oscillospiraceae bacterium]|nr:DUF805 domain-containing protein [Oscillospiraceae bacterium]
MNEYKAMWTNYANFSARTTVRGYWMAFLFNFLVSAVFSAIAYYTGFTLLSNLYALAALIPGLAISVRRLRDAGKPWGWLFINLIPVVGTIIFIVMVCKPSVEATDVATV